jgi:hypothetical protein
MKASEPQKIWNPTYAPTLDPDRFRDLHLKLSLISKVIHNIKANTDKTFMFIKFRKTLFFANILVPLSYKN